MGEESKSLPRLRHIPSINDSKQPSNPKLEFYDVSKIKSVIPEIPTAFEDNLYSLPKQQIRD